MLEQRLDARAERLESLPPRRRCGLAGGDAGDGLDDAVVPAEDAPRVGVGKTEGVRHHRDRQWPGETAPELRVAGGLDRVDQAIRLRFDERREPLAHPVEPERACERAAVPVVLCAVAGQHAGPDDLTGRKPRIVDGEGLRVAHDAQSKLATGDEPGTQRGKPGDRLVLAEPRETRMRVGRQLLERRLGSDRERVCPRDRRNHST